MSDRFGNPEDRFSHMGDHYAFRYKIQTELTDVFRTLDASDLIIFFLEKDFLCFWGLCLSSVNLNKIFCAVSRQLKKN